MTQRICLKFLLVSMTGTASFISGVNASGLDDRFQRYDLDERLADVSVSSVTSYEMTRHLVDRSRLPMGFEEKPDEQRRCERPNPCVRRDYSLRDLTLRRALNLLVQNDPDYKWTTSDGVINFIPSEGSLLDIRISSFVVSDVDIFAAAEALTAAIPQPEFRQALLESNRRRVYYGKYAPRLNINMVNPTLRECLNELVRQDGFTDWHVHYWKTGSFPRFTIVLILRNSGIDAANKRYLKIHVKERERQLIREGFRKTKGGAWVKPGPGGKWGPPDAAEPRASADGGR